MTNNSQKYDSFSRLNLVTQSFGRYCKWFQLFLGNYSTISHVTKNNGELCNNFGLVTLHLTPKKRLQGGKENVCSVVKNWKTPIFHSLPTTLEVETKIPFVPNLYLWFIFFVICSKWDFLEVCSRLYFLLELWFSGLFILLPI